MIIDYSTSRPAMSALRAAGVTAVGRYIGWDSVPGFSSIGKNLSKAEAALLISSGIDIFLSFEYLADAAAKGSGQGVLDGNLAMTQLAELGAPSRMAVYFAVDFDIPDYDQSLPDTPANALLKLGPVGRYFQAINNLKHAFEVGVYGGYYACKRVLDASLATKAWQTIAWSGGQLDSRVVLYQVAGTPIQGADLDIREHATVGNFGQWSHTLAPPPPPPPPPPANITLAVHTIGDGASGENVRTLQGCLTARRQPVTVDGLFGPTTLTVLKTFQAENGLVPDGVAGPLTWMKLLVI